MIALLVLITFADVTPAPIFSDGMLLQAGLLAPVFGIADAGESVTVEFRGDKESTSVGKDGRWIVRLKAGAAGAPFELKIQGKNLRVVKNVLCGEVWHASGQSNMAFPLKRPSAPPLVHRSKANLLQAMAVADADPTHGIHPSRDLRLRPTQKAP